MSEVIDIKSRKPWAQSRAEERKARRKASRKAKKDVADAVMEHRDNLVEALEKLLVLAKAGSIEGLILLAREPKSKLFLTEIVMDDRVVPPNDLHAFIGVLETLKLEVADSAAACAPCLTLDGTTIDPMAEPAEEDWDEE